MKTSQCTDAPRVALFQGSFDPFTRGHESIVRRALKLFDEVVIAIGVNINKQSFMTMDERRAWIESVFSDEPRVRVMAYTGLTIDVARQVGATCFLRGVRMIQDFETEMHMAEVNRELSGLETVLLYTLPKDSHVSSSIVRELVKYGRDVTDYLPSTVNPALIPDHWKVNNQH
ncbi:MAG: pantetheine-phosphate adenylyltransferase [Muribaculaceae bacterium]|nr:pantetheine-phosphate adenylyltransferase [Muribaculaceae bacterium]